MRTTHRIAPGLRALVALGVLAGCGGRTLGDHGDQRHGQQPPTCSGPNGATYAVGETYKVDCNTCTCRGENLQECTLIACHATVCTYSGQTYQVGTTIPTDCGTCRCEDDGTVACTTIACLPDAGAGVVAQPDATAGANVAAGPDAGPGAARGYAYASIAAASSGSCPSAGLQELLIGNTAAPGSPVILNPTSTLDTVTCELATPDAGSGFDFVLDVYHAPQPDDEGGFSLVGHVGPDGNASNVTAYIGLGGNNYGELDCTMAPSFRSQTNGREPAPPGVGPGRIVGTLVCPNEVGWVTPAVCSIGIDFAFDGCQR